MLSAFGDSEDLWRRSLSANCLGSLDNNTEGTEFDLASSGKYLIFK